MKTLKVINDGHTGVRSVYAFPFELWRTESMEPYRVVIRSAGQWSLRSPQEIETSVAHGFGAGFDGMADIRAAVV